MEQQKMKAAVSAVRGIGCLTIVIVLLIGGCIASMGPSYEERQQQIKEERAKIPGSYEEAQKVGAELGPKVGRHLCEKYGVKPYFIEKPATGNWGLDSSLGYFIAYAGDYEVQAVFERPNMNAKYLEVDGDVLLNEMNPSERGGMEELGMPWE